MAPTRQRATRKNSAHSIPAASRSYWVVSPNVGFNNATIPQWRQVVQRTHAAFMGWGKDHAIGMRFITAIERGDIILIARRHKGQPEVFGFGIDAGACRKKLDGVDTPQRYSSARRLSRFTSLNHAPSHVPLMEALGHTAALAQLHPDRNPHHKKVCQWLERHLDKAIPPAKEPSRSTVTAVEAPHNQQLDYVFRSKRAITKAIRREAKLVEAYRYWLQKQGRTLEILKYHHGLCCDGFEATRRNLIEAKSSTRREHIRMAVGQLLDYAFQSNARFGPLKMAILLPRKPDDTDLEKWLRSAPLKIHLIWHDKKTFHDNAHGQFT